MDTKERHFELTDEFITTESGVKLHRIRCTRAVQDVKAGDTGGFVEKPENLSDEAWVYGEAQVCGDARVYGKARVYGDARVYGNAEVFGHAQVFGEAEVFGNAEVCGKARVYGNTGICGRQEDPV